MVDPPATADDVDTQALLEQVEKKRLQNTAAARRSRLRKQARLDELEGENEDLRKENEAMKERLRIMEGTMRSLGLRVD